MNYTKNSLTLLICTILSLITFTSRSQLAKFVFHTEMCECVAEFDSTQYTREQLQNTIDFLWFAPYIENHGLVWSIDEMYDLNSTKLKSECEERIKTLRKIDIVDDEFWQKLRNEQIAFYEGTSSFIKGNLLIS